MALVKPIGPQHRWHQFLGGMLQPSPTQSRWSSSQIVTPSHSNSVSPPFDVTEIDNISAKRRKFVNVVDPHIKKEGLFHHLDGKILNDQRRGCMTWPSLACRWAADLVMVFSHARKRSSMFIERQGEAVTLVSREVIQADCSFLEAALWVG